MHDFTPLPALVGGTLIGASASLFFLTHGRIAGISGLFGSLLRRDATDRGSSAAFLVGMLASGVVAHFVAPAAMQGPPTSRGPLSIVIAGLLVGVGTSLGNGCTSGHGVCGIARRSKRSIVATCAFMAAGAAIAIAFARMTGSAS